MLNFGKIPFFLVLGTGFIVRLPQCYGNFLHTTSTEQNRHLMIKKSNTRIPSEKEIKLDQKKISAWNKRVGKKGLDALLNTVLEVNVYFIVFTDSRNNGVISTETITKQIQVLNDAFAGIKSNYPECDGDFTYEDTLSSPFVFNLVETRILQDDNWFDLESDRSEMKRESLREGDCSDLYIFTGDASYLGESRFPFDCAGDLTNDYIQLKYTTVPEGEQEKYNQGDTLVHEVGHWLGLFHTAQGGCLDRDYVFDTPAEKEPAFDCPLNRDTCTSSFQDGLDPIHNYMDYTDDCCMYQFTRNQIDRMVIESQLYRNLTYPPGTTGIDPPISPLAPLPPFLEASCKFPNDGFNYTGCDVPNDCWIGDGYCDVDGRTNYNSTECNYDGGDCLGFCPYPKDGFDYSSCTDRVAIICWLNDQECDPINNFRQCNYDGGDCFCEYPNDSFDYSSCRVEKPCHIGNGICDGIYFEEYNTSECNYDGGDCVCHFPNDGYDYSSCTAPYPCLVGDGHCDSEWNTSACKYDGGDCPCDFPKGDDGFDYSSCEVDVPCLIGNGVCDRGSYNSPECNNDGGDCEDDDIVPDEDDVFTQILKAFENFLNLFLELLSSLLGF